MKRPDRPVVLPEAPANDTSAPSVTEGPFAAWVAVAVPALPDDFTDRVVAEATGQGLGPAFAAWQAHAVPALPDDVARAVLAEADGASLAPAFAAWSAEAVPALPDTFTDRLLAEVTGQGLEPAFAAWQSHAVPALPDDFAASVAARVEAAKVTTLPTRTTGASRTRRWLWPALAVAAALLLMVVSRAVPGESPGAPAQTAQRALPTAPPVQTPPALEVAPMVAQAPATPPLSLDDDPVPVGAPGTEGGAEVTRMDVVGAHSYAVLQVPGVTPGTLTAVVWIDDKPEVDPYETAVQ